MRHIVERDPAAFCDWLEIDHGEKIELLSTSFTSQKREADFLARVQPGRLVHAEYISRPGPDMYARMLDYRARIMHRYPDESLIQYAIVLGRGQLRIRDDPEAGFALGLRVVYLRDVDRDELLRRPALCMLAELAQGDQQARVEAALAAARQIQTMPEDDQPGLFEALLNLATINLDRSIIDKIAKEARMNVEGAADFYADTKVGQTLLGRGREEGRTETLMLMLQARFGADERIPALVASLARQPDHAVAIAAVAQAESLDELLRLIDG